MGAEGESDMNLLVDLDGTITDPARGILAAIRHALEGVGLPAPPAEDLHWVIGPPLRATFPLLGVPPARVEEAIVHYRRRYVEGGGMYECDLIPGIADALQALSAAGHRLFVATSKPHVYARPIIAHFGLAETFVAVHGAELDGSIDSKADVIAAILAAHALAPETCIMIGDTPYDVEGARAHAIPTIGVNWGHGGDRLAASAPTQIVQHAEELPAAVAELAAAMRVAREG